MATIITALRSRRIVSHRWSKSVFQKELLEALKVADGVFIVQVARLEQIPEAERLHPEEMVKEISKGRRPAFYEKNADAIVDRIIPLLEERDIVAVFSNGGFDNIHEKLLARLRT